MTYPIAETFYSVQGEGQYAGTPMFFVRFAGCNVGRYQAIKTSANHPEKGDYAAPREVIEGDNQKMLITPSPFQLLHPEYSTCTAWNGKTFVCDTDYRVKERLTSEQILKLVQDSGATHVCLSGGEPFIHALEEIVDILAGFETHIETSGTKLISQDLTIDYDLWVTCSPKQGFLVQNVGRISEFKFLVRDESDESSVCDFLETFDIDDSVVWIQPVDECIDTFSRLAPVGDDALNRKAATYLQREFAIECVKRHPNWRLSIQAHKFLGVR